MSSLLNHILIHTSDFAKTSLFFKQTLNLKNGHRPPFGFPGAWLYSDDKPIIHLSETPSANKKKDKEQDNQQTDYLGNQENSSNRGMGIIDHIAFNGSDYPALMGRLKHHNLDYFERSIPLTGEHQVFVDGPDGIRIEIQFEKITI